MSIYCKLNHWLNSDPLLSNLLRDLFFSIFEHTSSIKFEILNLHRQTECLDNCTALLEYLYIKKKMLTQEMENCRRFVDGLISCLLKNRKAIFQTRGNMVFVKIDETHDHECSVIERFMISIINKQKNTIENLMTIHEEVNTMVNMMQLFAIVL